jgi:hypothetical protein
MDACVQEFLDIDSIHDVLFWFMTPWLLGRAGFHFYGMVCCYCAGKTGVVFLSERHGPNRREE